MSALHTRHTEAADANYSNRQKQMLTNSFLFLLCVSVTEAEGGAATFTAESLKFSDSSLLNEYLSAVFPPL